jgi:hypothetical protein
MQLSPRALFLPLMIVAIVFLVKTVQAGHPLELKFDENHAAVASSQKMEKRGKVIL